MRRHGVAAGRIAFADVSHKYGDADPYVMFWLPKQTL